MKAMDFDRAAPVFYLESCSSTNTLMKELARRGAPEGSVIVSAAQTEGRGRMGRSFASPVGGVYMSMLLRPEAAGEKIPQLSAVAALAVRRVIAALCGVPARIKWPNDLLLEGKKLCGILAESLVCGNDFAVILGIGVNLNTPAEAFPPELRSSACSLGAACGRSFDREEFIRRLVYELEGLYSLWQSGHSFREEYRAACVQPGQELLLSQNGESRPVLALDIDEDMSLLVRLPDGKTESIRWGEVSLRM